MTTPIAARDKGNGNNLPLPTADTALSRMPAELLACVHRDISGVLVFQRDRLRDPERLSTMVLVKPLADGPRTLEPIAIVAVRQRRINQTLEGCEFVPGEYQLLVDRGYSPLANQQLVSALAQLPTANDEQLARLLNFSFLLSFDITVAGIDDGDLATLEIFRERALTMVAASDSDEVSQLLEASLMRAALDLGLQPVLTYAACDGFDSTDVYRYGFGACADRFPLGGELSAHEDVARWRESWVSPQTTAGGVSPGLRLKDLYSSVCGTHGKVRERPQKPKETPEGLLHEIKIVFTPWRAKWQPVGSSSLLLKPDGQSELRLELPDFEDRVVVTFENAPEFAVRRLMTISARLMSGGTSPSECLKRMLPSVLGSGHRFRIVEGDPPAATAGTTMR